MHMSDALLSPEVGGVMWASTGVALAYSANKVKENLNDNKIPLMGIMGAFIFAAQMINFAIPGTGSSGHLGGGMILAVLLGPYAAFIVMASILLIQALFFADGGLLAFGCNAFNLGIFPAFIAYPLLYRKIAGNMQSYKRITIASILSVILALELGAVFVVLQTVLSGVSELPFSTFLFTMMPIHLAIALVEGVVTAIVINFLWKAEPGIFSINEMNKTIPKPAMKKVLLSLAVSAILIGGIFSWFASSNPDGLEWTIAKATGKEELETPESDIYSYMKMIQEKLSFLPDYSFKTGSEENSKALNADESALPVVDSGATTSGIIGGAITLLFIAAVAIIIRKRGKAT